MIKSFKSFNEAKKPYVGKPIINTPTVFDFQDWDMTDISGMGMEITIDNLIEETKALIEKEVEQIHSSKLKKMNDLVGLYSTPDSLKTKQEAAKAIADLWIEKIKLDLNFKPKPDS